jgi:hypothetical protein
MKTANIFFSKLLCVLALPTLGVVGCQSLSPKFYNKETALNGSAISAIDVKQRVVLTHEKKTKDAKGVERIQLITCAEPSPDALTVLGASNALSIAVDAPKANGSLNATSSVAEAGAFVGLRTQSIQLLRDAMYRLCEGYAAGAIDSNEFESMQRRFQSTMMGLIAIEQLTGPVVASQALLLSSAKASAGASAGDAAVDAAQGKVDAQLTKVTDAKNALDPLESALKEAETKVSENRRNYSSAQSELRGEEKDADKEQARVKIINLDNAHAELKSEVTTKQNAVIAGKRKLDQENATLSRLETALLAAQSRAASAADAGGSLAAIARSNSQATQDLTLAVGKIVEEINRAYTKDTCLNLISRLTYKYMDQTPEKKVLSVEQTRRVARGHEIAEATIKACQDVIDQDSKLRMTSLNRDFALKKAKLETEVKLLQQAAKRASESVASPNKLETLPVPDPITPKEKPAEKKPADVKSKIK